MVSELTDARIGTYDLRCVVRAFQALPTTTAGRIDETEERLDDVA